MRRLLKTLKITLEIEYNYRLFRLKRKYLNLVDVEVEGIDTRDAPDFGDAFISQAYWYIPLLDLAFEANEVDLDYLNEDSGLVYSHVQEALY